MKTRLPYKGRTGRRSPSERLRPHLLQRFPCPLTRIADNNSGSLAHQGKKNRASLSTEKRSAPSERLRGHLLTGVQTIIFNLYFNIASVHNLCIPVQLFNSSAVQPLPNHPTTRPPKGPTLDPLGAVWDRPVLLSNPLWYLSI